MRTPRLRTFRAALVSFATVGALAGATPAAHSTTPAKLRPIATAGARPVQHQSVLVIPARFSGEAEPITRAELATEYFDTAASKESVKNYWLQASRGNLVLDGAVAPWVVLDGTPPTGCPKEQLMADAIQKARAASVPLDADSYDYVALVMPGFVDYACGGNRGVSWDDRYTFQAALAPGIFRTGTSAHELGHDFGLGHSAVYPCSNGSVLVPVAVASDCTRDRDESRDFAENMGNTEGFHLPGGFDLLRLGFLPRTSLTELPVDGQFRTLVRLGEPVGTPNQVFRVRRSRTIQYLSPGEEDAFYYLDMRGVSAPFDDYPAGHSAVRGVRVSLASEVPTGDGMPMKWQVNPAPGVDKWGNAKRLSGGVGSTDADADAVLLPGQRMYDPIEDFTIAIGAVTAAGAEVRVSAGAPSGAPDATTLTNGQLELTAPSGVRNVVALGRTTREVLVVDSANAVTAPAGCRQINPITIGCPVESVRQIVVRTGDGDDVVTARANASQSAIEAGITVIPGAGDDVVQAANTRAIRVEASAAPDGADVIDVGNAAANVVSYAARTAPITAESSGSSTTIRITGENDVIYGLSGNANPPQAELVGGNAGDTFNIKGTGWVRLVGGPGNDRFDLGNGLEYVIARDGAADTFVGCGGAADYVHADAQDVVPADCETTSTNGVALISSGLTDRVVVNGSIGSYAFSDPGNPAATFECRLRAPADYGVAWSTCSSPKTVTPPGDGTWVFEVRTLNGSLEQSRRFTLDSSAPPVAASSAPGTPAKIEFSSSEAGAVTECSIDGAAFAACSSPVDYSTLPEGFHTARVRAVDAVGNGTSPAAEVPFRVGNHSAALTATAAISTASPINLTTAGGAVLDWMQWNASSASSFERKSGGTALATWTPIGSGSPTRTGVASWTPTHSWTDGATVTSGSSPYGVGVTGVGNGFELRIPLARLQLRRLVLRVGLRGATTKGRLSYSLGDGTGSTTVVDGPTEGSGVARALTVSARSVASPDDVLTVRWTLDSTSDSTGQVSLFSASLV